MDQSTQEFNQTLVDIPSAKPDASVSKPVPSDNANHGRIQSLLARISHWRLGSNRNAMQELSNVSVTNQEEEIPVNSASEQADQTSQSADPELILAAHALSGTAHEGMAALAIDQTNRELTPENQSQKIIQSASIFSRFTDLAVAFGHNEIVQKLV